MDSVFLLNEEDLTLFFQNMIQEFGCCYLCLWLHSPQSLQSPDCLHYKNGFYMERRSSDQASSSYGTLAQRLFNEYQQSIFILETSQIPGVAFQNNLPYTEFNSEDLLSLATTKVQRQFYQEAGIKTAVFMGCNAGEIEMGFSADSQVNLEMQMRNWFPQDMSRVPLIPTSKDLPQPTDHHHHLNPTAATASSSSSLRSLSYDDSTELYSPPFLFDMIPRPSSSSYASPEAAFRPAPAPVQSPSSSACPPQNLQQQPILHSLNQMQSFHGLSVEAILAAISSSSPPPPPPPLSSSSTLQATHNAPPAPPAHTGTKLGSAFKRYREHLGSRINVYVDRKKNQNMQKRCIVFLRYLNTMRAQEQHIQATNRPSNTQLHHMISERKRREKINDSFQSLRSLLPPAKKAKKDKASVLASTTEYLSSLKDEVKELSERNKILEAQFLPQTITATATGGAPTSDSLNYNASTLDVRITNVGESTSEDQARTVDLHVIIRNGENGILDNVIRLLEFLKRDQNVNLMTIEANTIDSSSTSVNRIVLRLRLIQGNEWDESTFLEAIQRIFN